MNQLACRLCRKVLTAETGCEVCDPIRRNLVVLGDRPEERVDLGDLSTEALLAARARLKKIRQQMKANDTRFRSSELHDLLRTISQLTDSARKIRKEGVSALNAMGFQDRAELFVEWWASLAPVHRDYVKGKLESASRELQ